VKPHGGIQRIMKMPHRQVSVPPDRFEVVADDVVFTVELQSALALCIYDALDEAGALLHLRLIMRGAKPVDVTDTTLATELLLLDRCVQTLRETAPAARNLQAKIVAHLPAGAASEGACDSVLTLLRHFLADVNIEEVSADIGSGAARALQFRPSMGWLQIR
jgi:chemotaxis receptor (MCP) glutamine deamidase CheD